AWLDPLKDVKAEREAIAGGLISRRESVASRGYDIEEVDQEIADDNARAKRLGLAFDAPPPDTNVEVAAA
ncbi:MAG: phage portal protein, partial [Rhizobiales bacterium]|nr:phage portal protein [Hyphomicrobiales bacterium]